MATMYETIMNLPLFKGISEDQISAFLERTSIEFLNFGDEEVIVEPEEKVDGLKFIISGSAVTKYELFNGGLLINEYSGIGRVFGVEYLFGLKTRYPFKVLANRSSGVMKIRKEEYMRLVTNDSVYSINYFNYISAKAQRNYQMKNGLMLSDIQSQIFRILTCICVPGSDYVEIICPDFLWAKICRCKINEITIWKEKAREEGLISFSESKIIVREREFLKLNE